LLHGLALAHDVPEAAAGAEVAFQGRLTGDVPEDEHRSNKPVFFMQGRAGQGEHLFLVAGPGVLDPVFADGGLGLQGGREDLFQDFAVGSEGLDV